MKSADEPQHGAETLKERYVLLEEIGRGSQGTTYLADDVHSGSRVAIKELSLGKVEDWKAVELFERETQTLQNLDHPAIPRFLDSFHLDQEGSARLFLVQDFVEGKTLREVLEKEPVGLKRTLEITRSLLEILVYLQSFSPPVIHRDIKPSNIIEVRDGSIFLVDFGGVQTLLPDQKGGSTIVGTTGYMAPEQLMGRAGPASDLYGVGTTMVHLLTGVSPADLPVERMKLVWRDRVGTIPDRILDFTDRLLEPHIEDRYEDAREALRIFDESGERKLSRDLMRGSPVHSKIRISEVPDGVELTFPASGGGTSTTFVATGSVTAVALVATIWMTSGMLAGVLTLGVFIIGALVYLFVFGKHDVVRRTLRLDRSRGTYHLTTYMTGDKELRSGSLSEVVGAGKGVSYQEGLCLATHHGMEPLQSQASEAERAWVDEVVRSTVRDFHE